MTIGPSQRATMRQDATVFPNPPPAHSSHANLLRDSPSNLFPQVLSHLISRDHIRRQDSGATFSLSHVCPRSRGVVLSSPKLWSSSIQLKSDEATHGTTLVCTVDGSEWFLTSGSSPFVSMGPLITPKAVLREYRGRITAVTYVDTTPGVRSRLTPAAPFRLVKPFHPPISPTPSSLSLALAALDITTEYAVSLKGVLQFMRHCGVLEVLRLRCKSPEVPAFPENFDHVTPFLPHHLRLKTVELDGYRTQPTGAFLQKLPLSEHTSVRLFFRTRGHPTFNPAPLKANIALIQEACITYSAGGGVATPAGSSSDAAATPRQATRSELHFSDCTGHFVLHWSWAVAPGEAPEGLGHIGFQGYDFRAVKALTVTLHDVRLADHDWQELLAPFRGVTRLSVQISQEARGLRRAPRLAGQAHYAAVSANEPPSPAFVVLAALVGMKVEASDLAPRQEPRALALRAPRVNLAHMARGGHQPVSGLFLISFMLFAFALLCGLL